MLVPWRVDTSKLLVCSHRAGGTNVKDLSEVFLLHEFIARKKFTNLHKETFSTPRVSYIHFMGTQKRCSHFSKMRLLQSETAPHLGPAGGLSFHPWKKAIFSIRQAISLSFGRKKEDERRDPLAVGGTAGFMLLRRCLEKNAEKNLRGFLESGAKAPEEKTRVVRS